MGSIRTTVDIVLNSASQVIMLGNGVGLLNKEKTFIRLNVYMPT
jgi:hypothetical protein